MPIKRPVNHEPAPDDILLRHRPPVTTVITRVTVVAQREITVRRHSETLIARSEVSTAERIATIGKLCTHDALEAISFCRFPVDVEERRINSKGIARSASEPLNEKGRARFRILWDQHHDVSRAKHKHITAMWFDKIVGELVDENLIAGVNRAPCNHLPRLVMIAREDMKILL